MTDSQEDSAKVLFRFYSNLFEEEMIETLWTITVDEENGLYKIDSIPFYIPLVASDDIVLAEYDEQEQMLTYRKIISHSGNSIVQIILTERTENIDSVRNTFQELDCKSEKLNSTYFSMEIPRSTDYKRIKRMLEELETKGIIGYAESCLSERHRQ
jgi:hypothetical protein